MPLAVDAPVNSIPVVFNQRMLKYYDRLLEFTCNRVGAFRSAALWSITSDTSRPITSRLASERDTSWSAATCRALSRDWRCWI